MLFVLTYFPKVMASPSDSRMSARAPLCFDIALFTPKSRFFSSPVPVTWSAWQCVFAVGGVTQKITSNHRSGTDTNFLYRDVNCCVPIRLYYIQCTKIIHSLCEEKADSFECVVKEYTVLGHTNMTRNGRRRCCRVTHTVTHRLR